jgi:hypothetical protein
MINTLNDRNKDYSLLRLVCVLADSRKKSNGFLYVSNIVVRSTALGVMTPPSSSSWWWREYYDWLDWDCDDDDDEYCGSPIVHRRHCHGRLASPARACKRPVTTSVVDTGRLVLDVVDDTVRRRRRSTTGAMQYHYYHHHHYRHYYHHYHDECHCRGSSSP